MARRGENIYKRKDGRWEGRYIKGRKLNNQIIYGYIYNRKYSIVKQQLIYYKSMYQHEIVIQDYTGTISNWLEYWLNNEVKRRVKPSTFASYKHKIHRYITPYIGMKTLKKISDETLQNWVDQLIELDLSPSTIKLVVQIFRMAIKSAQKRHYLWSNPTKGLIIPKINKRKVLALSLREQNKLEEEALQSYKGASVLISLYTGLRIGEISALKWTDIDFFQKIIHVHRTMQRIPLKNGLKHTQLLIQEAKTLDSKRSIPFSNKLKRYLLQLKKLSTSEFVIALKNKALEPRSITYHFRKILEKINLEHLHFHQLRHTFATRALEVGGDIASVSALLGHQSPKITLDVYADSLLHQRKNITKKIENKYFLTTCIN